MSNVIRGLVGNLKNLRLIPGIHSEKPIPAIPMLQDLWGEQEASIIKSSLSISKIKVGRD